jgi:hypothetical protein
VIDGRQVVPDEPEVSLEGEAMKPGISTKDRPVLPFPGFVVSPLKKDSDEMSGKPLAVTEV